MSRLQGKAESGPVALALGGLLALASAIGIGRFVYTPILPAMVEGLRMANSEAGLIASANLVGYLTGALLAAAPRLPGSRRTWLLGALALGAATTGAMGLVSSLPAFLALRGIGGAASAFVLVFASALVLDRLAAAGRGSLSSLHFAGVGVGIGLSAVLVSSLLTAGADWRLLWLGSGAAALATVPLVAWLVPGREAPRAAVTPVSRPAGLAAASSMTRWTLAYGLFGFGYIVTATFLVAIVRASPEIRPIEPFVWVIVGITAAPSVAAWAWLGTRIGISRAFAVACLVEAAGVAASVLWPTATGALMAAALLGGTFMGITALGLAGGRRLAGGDPRRAFALLTASFSVGQIAGPVLAGFLLDRTGGFVLPTLLAAGALLAAAVLGIGVNMPKAIGDHGPAAVDRSGG
ncbi:YbfB/YjiJ family MFS transporter [Paeniroseomonas aquatica]|uniref:YbfB/YjiJ family MFS transporter n=1 Tax=Paeniroseomonas aquatica TaxID=373043 RepID=A0ABT8A024_9PROT|nr:YbfB/YjiJ family MFS transporter [Paeniroseomonas aquatica]MDN3562966.1 YbfB/YjiJ family MFS transporter [Paeniroseomonas aquatica]